MKGNLKGLIALDIDGTVTAVRDHLQSAVVDYLAELARAGWQIYFITGRTFHWSYTLLKDLPFPYLLGVHNGAFVASMPQRDVLFQSYLKKAEVVRIEAILQRYGSAGVIYTGPQGAERTYICPGVLPPERLEYLHKRRAFVQEEWIEVDSIEAIAENDFLAVRCLETREVARDISRAITDELSLPCPLMMDSCSQTYALVQVTQKEVTKGSAINHVLPRLGITGPIIAAGDDHNDIALLESADIKVAMQTAPPELLKLADVVAPPASECGIIQGLKEAIARIS